MRAETDISLKPRVLIADDSRIVRATLIKHIQGMFDFCEAVDGEQAWERLLLDQSIRVVITDLTMPKLDGYGLLERIRTSKVSRISNLPVVVVSGSDEQEERERAKSAGATDLITKGIDTAQLLSRLDVLSKLSNTEREYGRGLEALVSKNIQEAEVKLPSPYTLQTQAEAMLAYATQHNTNFVLLNVCLRMKRATPLTPSSIEQLPLQVVNAIGQLLQKTIRQSDCVAKTAEMEFTIATGSINLPSALSFGARLCNAISSVTLPLEEGTAVVASCGVVSLCEYREKAERLPSLNTLWDVAHRRGALGAAQGNSGVVSIHEEAVQQNS